MVKYIWKPGVITTAYFPQTLTVGKNFPIYFFISYEYQHTKVCCLIICKRGSIYYYNKMVRKNDRFFLPLFKGKKEKCFFYENFQN